MYYIYCKLLILIILSVFIIIIIGYLEEGIIQPHFASDILIIGAIYYKWQDRYIVSIVDPKKI